MITNCHTASEPWGNYDDRLHPANSNEARAKMELSLSRIQTDIVSSLNELFTQLVSLDV
jgi:hypothetical protein